MKIKILKKRTFSFLSKDLQEGTDNFVKLFSLKFMLYSLKTLLRIPESAGDFMNCFICFKIKTKTLCNTAFAISKSIKFHTNVYNVSYKCLQRFLQMFTTNKQKTPQFLHYSNFRKIITHMKFRNLVKMCKLTHVIKLKFKFNEL